jgi:AcrR family transcriptional regulator
MGLLRSGRRFEHVSLRDVARELGIPMSTLTYVYSSITDLMDDFSDPVEDVVLGEEESGGLREALTGSVERWVAMMSGDLAIKEIWRYRLSRVGSGAEAASAERAIDRITRIRQSSGESYALSDEEIGMAYSAMSSGVALIWLDSGGGDPEALRRAALAGVDLVVQSAAPATGGREGA